MLIDGVPLAVTTDVVEQIMGGCREPRIAATKISCVKGIVLLRTLPQLVEAVYFQPMERLFMKKIAAIVMALTLSGCASIVDSSSQETTINSTPQGARCDLVREGAVIGTVSSTPAKVNYKRRYADAEVVCKKPGYKDTKAPLSSDTNAWTFGNIIFGGLIGWGIDAGTGAMNKYDEAITVTLPAAAPEEKPAPARTLKSKPNS
jgi:uncharacterized protein YceK